MSTPLPVTSALLQAGLRQRILDVKQALALRHPLSECQDDISRIAAVLSTNPSGISSTCSSNLISLLPAAGDELSGYRLLARLGHGQLGTTWLAQGNRGLVVAKRIHAMQSDPAADSPVMAVLQALVGGGQRYLVSYLAVIRSSDGTLCVIEDYRPGRDVAQRVTAKGPVNEKRALTILRQAAKGLAQLQLEQRCHGNLHPGNILLDTDGRAALNDYALVGNSASAHCPGWNAVSLKRHAWAAPEELGPHPIPSTAADIYALGCIGYWLLTGRHPFPGTAEIQRLQHLGAARPDVRQAAPQVSELTAKTLLKMMQQEAPRRYSDARLLIRSLERNIDALEVASSPTDHASSRPFPAKPVAGEPAFDPKASLELLEPQ